MAVTKEEIVKILDEVSRKMALYKFSTNDVVSLCGGLLTMAVDNFDKANATIPGFSGNRLVKKLICDILDQYEINKGTKQ